MHILGEGFASSDQQWLLHSSLAEDHTQPVRERGPGDSLGGWVQPVSVGTLSLLQHQ